MPELWPVPFGYEKEIMDCDKTIFPTEQDALIRIDQIKKFGEKRDKVPQRAYMCTKCQNWHLTSTTKKQYRSNMKKFFRKRRMKLENEARYWINKMGWDENDM